VGLIVETLVVILSVSIAAVIVSGVFGYLFLQKLVFDHKTIETRHKNSLELISAEAGTKDVAQQQADHKRLNALSTEFQKAVAEIQNRLLALENKTIGPRR
jgi:hypothetical protein